MKGGDRVRIEPFAQGVFMSQSATDRIYWTIADLELLPDNGTRYEIIDGELLMTRAPAGGTKEWRTTFVEP